MSEDSGEKNIFDRAREDIMRRADEAGIDYFHIPRNLNAGSGRGAMVLSMPNGRAKRSVVVEEGKEPTFKRLPFERLTILGQYYAVLDRETGDVEAMLTPALGVQKSLYAFLVLPGVEMFDYNPETNTTQQVVYRREDIVLNRMASHEFFSWKLPVSGSPDGQIEFATTTVLFEFLVPGLDVLADAPRVSLRLERTQCRQHDEALAMLESVSSSLLFELDLRFRFAFSLSYRYEGVEEGAEAFDEYADRRPLAYPRVRYVKDAVSLYSYGRAAVDMPLLRY